MLDKTQLVEIARTTYGSNKKDIQKYFDEVVDKVVNNIQLEEVDKEFLKAYLQNYYFHMDGGKWFIVNPWNRLTESHKKLAKYLVSNNELLDMDYTRYLIFYFCSMMSEDYNIRPYIEFESEEFNDPNGPAFNDLAYHTVNDYGMPVIAFNPRFINMIIKEHEVKSLINACFHELEHEVQNIRIKSPTLIDAQSLIWAKEKIMHRYVDNYYKLNYMDVFYERDARYYAANRTEEVLREYGNPNKKYYSWLDNIKPSPFSRNVKHIRPGDNKEELAVDLLDMMASDMIKKYPGLLKKHSVLYAIYNQDGTKKNIIQINNELDIQKQNEIAKNPDKASEISEKYKKLLQDIAKSDHDLLMQYYCVEADDYAKDNNQVALKIRITRINDITKIVNESYEEFEARIKHRIKVLGLVKPGDPRFTKAAEEKHACAELLANMLKYNQEFKRKHDEIELNKKYKREIERIVKKELTDKYGVFGSGEYAGSIILYDKSNNEIINEYYEFKKKIMEAELDSDTRDNYLEYLTNLYLRQYIKSTYSKNERQSRNAR